ncbi:MAG: T9SS type A sorting domain-containing protein [Rhodothermales bacterium]|nr:T9SS type A sorting domain-containing protein [Rhodothermales bacterium]MBO6779146.1 T9SS type A sorting domain-containing protein [Rhodothermales bacterium]
MRHLLPAIGLLLLVQTAGAQSAAHLCGNLLGAERFAPAIEALKAERRAGIAPARKGMSPPDIGDRQSFRVYLWSSNSWANREFELRDKTDLYYAWVEVANLGQMQDSELAAIREAMVVRTPTGSISTTQGVMANAHDVFGTPPDVDGDGIVDFLFYDIDNANVGGFVHPSDLTADQPGNGRDVLHLDVLQSVSFMPRLIAHEYVHLIHFNYEFDPETFISEGVAEYGMVVNGYTSDTFGYLALPTEHKRGLFSWRDINEDGVGRDYDRGRLFFSYIADQLDPSLPGEVVRNERKGAAGVDSVVTRAGRPLAAVIADFHTANLVDDPAVDERFGYTRSFSAPLVVTPDFRIETTTAETTPEASPEDRISVEGGAVHYIHFDELANLTLDFDAYAPPVVVAIQPGILDDIRTRLRGRVVATREDGSLEWHDVPPSRQSFRLTGNFIDVTLIVTSVSPIKEARYALDASWGAFGSASTSAESGQELPGGFSVRSVYPNPATGSASVTLETGQATPVRVYLVDALGREVREVHRSLLAAGEHVFRIDTNGLPSGAYLLVAEGTTRHAKPITVLR